MVAPDRRPGDNVVSRQQEPCDGVPFLLSCYWSKADNAGGLGVEPLRVRQRERATFAESSVPCLLGEPKESA